ncbi:hypothetical protein F0U63_24515 [Cystobacter fuscus]|nr:hypothetical protein F0U63_24515 [Cystobacter fuscus]
MPCLLPPRSSPFTVGLALVSSLVGCAHAPGPREVATAYVRALEENRLEAASALTSLPPEARAPFLTHYADAEARRARIAQVRAALPELWAQGPSLSLIESKEGWRVVEESPQDAPRALLTRFLDATEAADWETAWSLLSSSLRARYTPERLREDFQREPLAAERVRRARLAVKGPVEVTEGGAAFPLGEQRAVRLTREAGEYRVEALE